jgi:hypothetical protein
MFPRIGLVRYGLVTLAFCCFSSPAFSGEILFDDFNGTGGVPKNWMQILGKSGDVKEQPHDLTITDSTGKFAGIASTLPSSAFNPQGVVTTVQAQINSVSKDGNAVFGLFGLNGTGYLAAGIDAQGHVVIVEQQQSPNIPQAIVPIGVDMSYKAGPILMNFIITSKGVRVTAPGFDSGEVLFGKDLHNFSLAAAFKDGAVPALVGASQPNTTDGSASFASIEVSTGLGATVPEPSSLSVLVIGLAGLGVVGILCCRLLVSG